MTTVIELWDLHCDEADFRKLISALFCSEDIVIEKDLDARSGKVVYITDYLITIIHDRLIGDKYFYEIARILSKFCETCRIKNEDGEEIAFSTTAN